MLKEVPQAVAIDCTMQLPPPEVLPSSVTTPDCLNTLGTRLPQEKLTGEVINCDDCGFRYFLFFSAISILYAVLPAQYKIPACPAGGPGSLSF